MDRSVEGPGWAASEALPYAVAEVGVAATVVEDLVSRKWLANIVSDEETSTQVELAFTDALERGGLMCQWSR